SMPSIYSIGVGGSNYVTLNWWVYTVGIPAGDRIERALDNNSTPGPWTEIAHQTNYFSSSSGTFPGQPNTYYNDSNVIVGATYWYRLRVYDVAGISDYSAPVHFTVEPPPPLWNFSATS